MRRLLRSLVILVAVLAVVAGVLAAIGLANARAVPLERRLAVALPGWPAGAPPLRVALLSDVHFGGATMDAKRLEGIVAAVNAARPDLILIAGDFVNGHKRGDAATVVAPLAQALARLKAPLGMVAVLGNHDHWTGAPAVARAVTAAGGTLLVNGAVRRGPLALGGVDDDYTGHEKIAQTVAAMRALSGARVLLSHSPDVSPRVPGDVALVLAGHSHCGQVVLPLVGPPVLPLHTGRRYLCGVVREGARSTIVSAGLGTSVVPFRFGAPPDWWLLTLGPAHA